MTGQCDETGLHDICLTGETVAEAESSKLLLDAGRGVWGVIMCAGASAGLLEGEDGERSGRTKGAGVIGVAEGLRSITSFFSISNAPFPDATLGAPGVIGTAPASRRVPNDLAERGLSVISTGFDTIARGGVLVDTVGEGSGLLTGLHASLASKTLRAIVLAAPLT